MSKLKQNEKELREIRTAMRGLIDDIRAGKISAADLRAASLAGRLIFDSIKLEYIIDHMEVPQISVAAPKLRLTE